MSKRRVVATLACAAVLALAGAFHLTAGAAESRTPDPRSRLAGVPPAETFNKEDRGNTRTLFSTVILNSSSSGNIAGVTNDTEIDATSITFAIHPNPAVPGTTSVNAYAGFGVSGVFPANSYMKGVSTIVHNFNPPIRLRFGDYAGFLRLGDPLPPGAIITCEVVIHGFIPSVNRSEGFMVQ